MMTLLNRDNYKPHFQEATTMRFESCLTILSTISAFILARSSAFLASFSLFSCSSTENVLRSVSISSFLPHTTSSELVNREVPVPARVFLTFFDGKAKQHGIMWGRWDRERRRVRWGVDRSDEKRKRGLFWIPEDENGGKWDPLVRNWALAGSDEGANGISCFVHSWWKMHIKAYDAYSCP